MTDALAIMAAPFAACVVLTGIHAYLGLHVLARGVIFVDLALAQVAALGATGAFLLGHEVGGGVAYGLSLLAALAAALIFALSRRKVERVPQEAIIGVVYAVAAAGVILLVDRAPHGGEHIKTLLVGQILWVDWVGVAKLAGLYALVGALHYALRQPLLLVSQDPDEARSQGLSIWLWDFLFYASFAVVVTSSVAIAGVLLVFSFLIVPALLGVLLAEGLGARLKIAWAAGGGIALAGCALSYAFDLPTGAAVVCTFGADLALVAPVASRLRR